MSGGLLEALAADEEQRILTKLEAAFTNWAAGTLGSAFHGAVVSVEGLADPVIGEAGRRADFVVVARPAADDEEPTRRTFRAALFRTERPVLVVPPGQVPVFGNRVAIAWKDDTRAAKAVLPALRCLARAERLHVLAGVRQGAGPPALPQVFLDHGIKAELHIVPIGAGAFGQALLDKAHQLGADLLVMGAYAHSPLREALLGGVTRYMLAHADLPVLMRH